MNTTQKIIVLSVLCFFSEGVLAFDFAEGKNLIGNVFDGAKKAIEKEKERQEKIRQAEEKRQKEEKERKNPTVEDSRLVIKESLSADSKWAFIKIEKDDYKEEFTMAVSNGVLNRPLYLKGGAGIYHITIFATASSVRYSSSYLYAFDFNVKNLDTRDMSYLLPSENVQSDDSRILSLAQELTAGIHTDVEKIKAIHDYVAGLIEYNWEGYNDGSYQNEETDALSVLKRPKTVCAGYSNLFAAIVRAAGIRARVIHGTAMGSKGAEKHAWNEVYIDQEWKIVDVTWDDTENLRYDYFFPNIDDFAKDHLKEEVQRF